MLHRLYLKFIFFYLILAVSNVLNAQELTIKYIGNCAYKITFDSLSIYSDFPYKSGAYGYMSYNIDSVNFDKERKGYILFTHKHADHFDKKTLKKINFTSVYPGLSHKKKNEIFNELNFNYGIKVTPIKTNHKWSINHNSYLLEWKGKSIYFFGDTHDYPQVLFNKEIDLIFITTWAVRDIKLNNDDLKVKKLILYHLGPKETGMKDHLTRFLNDNLNSLKKKPEYLILKQYQETIIKL